jgi:hypothetical protein
MSFLIDPPLLVASGAAIEMLAPSDTAADLAEVAVLGVFLGTSMSLYMNAPWTEPIWRLCGANSGRDWMINSGVLHIDCEEPTHEMNTAAALIFATYPLWLRLGRLMARPFSPLSRLRRVLPLG